MHCNQCGAKLEPNSKYCESCGSPVELAITNVAHEYNSPEPLNQSVNSEVVVWVLKAQRIESFFKRKACYLIFMKDKLIVAHLSKESQREENAKLSSEIKNQGKGFLKGSVAMMQHWANYHDKYYSMTSGQILAEDPANLEIKYHDIETLYYKCESTYMDADGRNSGHSGKIVISLSDGEKIKFSHSNSHDSEVKRTLTELFDNKLKYRI